MFKRKDWVFLQKGQGASGEADSSSSSSSDEKPESESPTESSAESSELEQEVSNDVSHDSEGASSQDIGSADLVDDNGLASQIDMWYHAKEENKTIKGRALACKICNTKKLLLNSSMFLDHITSGKHRTRVATLENAESIDMAECFVFADNYNIKDEEVETHTERLERIQNMLLKEEASNERKSRNKGKKRRKTRPGKRQREKIKQDQAKSSP